MIKDLYANKNLATLLREIVFGVEDGTVSTLGAISGIAIGSQDQRTVLLAGIVIIAVESISMAIGSFLSNSTAKELNENAVRVEKELLQRYPDLEQRELYDLYRRDGWHKNMAHKMVKMASLDKNLMLTEHTYRDLGIFPHGGTNPLISAGFMFISYIVGGLLPLGPYFVYPISVALPISLIAALLGLFGLGYATTLFTKAHPLKAGLRTLLLGGVAFCVGLFVGKIAA